MVTKITAGSQLLIEFLQSLGPLNDEVIDFISKTANEIKVARGQLLLSDKEVCEHYYYIKKGLIRGYIIDEGKEVTTWICREGEIITSIINILNANAVGENIKTLENCELIAVPSAAVQQLYDLYPEFNRIGRMLLERYYFDAHQSAIMCRIPNAARRYESFIHTRPELANRVPGKYIASFLNMTEETLSRVRSARIKSCRKPVSGNHQAI